MSVGAAPGLLAVMVPPWARLVLPMLLQVFAAPHACCSGVHGPQTAVRGETIVRSGLLVARRSEARAESGIAFWNAASGRNLGSDPRLIASSALDWTSQRGAAEPHAHARRGSRVCQSEVVAPIALQHENLVRRARARALRKPEGARRVLKIDALAAVDVHDVESTATRVDEAKELVRARCASGDDVRDTIGSRG